MVDVLTIIVAAAAAKRRVVRVSGGPMSLGMTLFVGLGTDPAQDAAVAVHRMTYPWELPALLAQVPLQAALACQPVQWVALVAEGYARTLAGDAPVPPESAVRDAFAAGDMTVDEVITVELVTRDGPRGALIHFSYTDDGDVDLDAPITTTPTSWASEQMAGVLR